MSEYDKDEVEEGWMLEEALEDVRRNSDQWHEYRDVLKDIEFAKNRKSADNEENQRPAIRHSRWREIQSARLVILANPQIKLDRLNQVFRSELDSLLAEGHYVAFGKNGGISEPYDLIELSYWQDLTIISYHRSTAQEITQAKAEWLKIRVFNKGEEPQPTNATHQSSVVVTEPITAGDRSITEPPPPPIYGKNTALNKLENLEKTNEKYFRDYYCDEITEVSMTNWAMNHTGIGYNTCRDALKKMKKLENKGE